MWASDIASLFTTANKVLHAMRNTLLNHLNTIIELFSYMSTIQTYVQYSASVPKVL